MEDETHALCAHHTWVHGRYLSFFFKKKHSINGLNLRTAHGEQRKKKELLAPENRGTTVDILRKNNIYEDATV